MSGWSEHMYVIQFPKVGSGNDCKVSTRTRPELRLQSKIHHLQNTKSQSRIRPQFPETHLIRQVDCAFAFKVFIVLFLQRFGMEGGSLQVDQ